MKHVLSLLAAGIIAFSALAQDNPGGSPYAYVKASGVNLRYEPSTSSAVGAKASYGDLYAVVQSDGDWTQVEVCNGPDSEYYWIASRYVETLNHTGFPENKLDAQFSYEKDADFGMLSFEKVGTDPYGNQEVSYYYWIKNRELQETGGNGIVVNEAGKVLYVTGNLLPPEGWEDYSTVYDAEKGLLWFGGILWEEDDK